MTINTIFCNQCGSENSVTSQFCSKCGSPLSGAAPVSNRLAPADATLAAPPQPQDLHGAGPSHSLTPTRYGGFWIRFVAAIIDGIVVQIVVAPFAFIVGMITGVAGAATGNVGRGLSVTAIMLSATFGLFASWLYEALMESSSHQATLGKMIFSMKVTDLLGRRISFARATARHFCKYISGMILLLGYVMAGFTEKKQALHDMIAATIVRRH